MQYYIATVLGITTAFPFISQLSLSLLSCSNVIPYMTNQSVGLPLRCMYRFWITIKWKICCMVCETQGPYWAWTRWIKKNIQSLNENKNTAWLEDIFNKCLFKAYTIATALGCLCDLNHRKPIHLGTRYIKSQNLPQEQLGPSKGLILTNLQL